MPLADQYPSQHQCSGNPNGFTLEEVRDRIEHFLRTVLPEIVVGLNGWEPNKKGRRNERSIAADLCKDLNFSSPLFSFHSEDPQDAKAVRTLDMGTYLRTHLQVAGRLLGARDCLYGIEVKRLPPPTSSYEDRTREYVIGRWDEKASKSKPRSGGIERFKECLHGEGLDRSAMIGLVQSEGFRHWHGAINGWIDELITAPIDSHVARWELRDRLVAAPAPHARIAEFRSEHSRSDSTTIRLTHFWLDLIAA
jgi:hypothetical protein